MAGDNWIRINKSLPSGPKILRLMELTSCPREVILGRLWILWAWVDDHVREDGRLRVTSVALLAQLLGGDEAFWLALLDDEVRWLARDSDGLLIPEWDRWFGSSRRARSAKAERQKAYRDRQKAKDQKNDAARGITRGATSDAGVAQHDAPIREERRREDKREEKSLNAPAPTSAPRARSANTSSLSPTSAAIREIEAKEPDWEAVRATANKVRETLGLPPPSKLGEEDRELVRKISALVDLAAIAEHELWTSCEAVVSRFASDDPPKIRRCGYWHGVLASILAERGVTLNALLKHVDVSPLLAAKPPPAALKAG